MFILPQFCGRGIATLLLDFAEEFARNNHIPNLFSEVSITARPFFEKRGFIVEQEQLVKVNNVEMDNFRMRKSLYIMYV